MKVPVYLLTYPLAFLGLLGIPALVAIYWLRNRYRRYPVSSLLLWLDPREAREGGTRVDRLQTPLLLVLELLAVVFLVLGASDPRVQSAQGARPLLVILDDSFSMLAGGGDSPRQRALLALQDEVRSGQHYSVRFLLAGDRPLSLGEPVRTTGEAAELLKGWSCRSASACLPEAIAFASELGGDWAHLLVVTDHPPDPPPGKGRVRWWAFGTPRANLAFVNAARTHRDGADRCLFEIANLSNEVQTTSLVIEAGEPPQEIKHSRLELAPGQTQRVVLQLAEEAGTVTARIDKDALDIDNQVILLPAIQKPVRADVRVREENLRTPLVKALRSIRTAVVTGTRPDIVFTDRDDAEADGPDTWLVRLLAEKDAQAYTGPFVTDRSHPLTEGLALQGVVWGAGKTEQITGAVVIMAGNVPLVTDTESLTGRHEVRLRLRPDLSTLQDSPNWPILVWNLLQWQASLAPGLSRSNVRLGEETVLTLAPGPQSVQLTLPDRSTRTLSVQGRRVVVRVEDVGTYQIRAGEETWTVAANALAREESDLTGCATGQWGDWLDEIALRLEYQSIAWIFLVLVFGVLGLHLFLVARAKGRRNL
jgi:hypothetical protein